MNPTDKAKTINGLMIHLRDDCGININGSKEKLQLTQYGYYHGYKGYRFIKKRQNTIPYTNFSEIIAVINYDNALKKLVYPALMFIEMAVKRLNLEMDCGPYIRVSLRYWLIGDISPFDVLTNMF